MIDVAAAALDAVALHATPALPLVFAAGAVTGVGPCAAPRYVAVAALVHGARRPLVPLSAFVAGLAGAYIVLGLAAGAFAALWSASTMLYAALAAALAACGVVALLRAGGDAHACAAAPRHDPSIGGALLLGASSALVVAPCCTPLVAALAGLRLANGPSADGALLLAAFACGHATPVVAFGAFGSRLSALLGRAVAAQAPAIVAGSLMLALAAYYGALA